MPETTDDARSAALSRETLEGLPYVQSTALSLSSYREILRPWAETTHHWLGTMVGPHPERAAESAFYPLIRIGRVDLPEEGVTGRLHDLLFLKGASFFWRQILHYNAKKDADRSGPVLISPRPLPEGCPIRQHAVAPCDTCAHWAHCATQRLALADLRFIKIKGVHFRKCCEVKGEWKQAGDTVKRVSFHTADGHDPAGRALTGAALQALPQFEPYY